MITTVNEWKRINESADSKIRVSCSALASIVIDGKYLLCVNHGSAAKGDTIYTPFGGATEYHSDALSYLQGLGCEFERKTPDLRFWMPESNLPEYLEWFNKKQQRETSIDRELMEELVEEEHIFDALGVSDFTATYRTVVFDKAEFNGVESYRYFEIFDVSFNAEKQDAIMKMLSQPNSKIKLVTAQEIRAGRAADGSQIGNNTKPLL